MIERLDELPLDASRARRHLWVPHKVGVLERACMLSSEPRVVKLGVEPSAIRRLLPCRAATRPLERWVEVLYGIEAVLAGVDRQS